MKWIWMHMQNAHHSAQGDVARRSSTNPACSSVKNAVPSASASLRGSMGTRLYALATITGRPSAEDPNAPKILPVISLLSLVYFLKFGIRRLFGLLGVCYCLCTEWLKIRLCCCYICNLVALFIK